ncbi:hypothetical protein [Mesoterricola sediminis]|uniref:Fe/B12 periplasmic-binding domain-containing protein n=1 Tax=Mesoterricola sediminis TaxID=2927980 RepID=A0AA48KCX0_9BACT|nr:hypothetical protein [Mesoterricola sediminis]BDU75757.1 hypothetical protein METESE_07150 [Mesoterricola sediminis]
MQIARTGSREISITGNIKTTDDYLAIRRMAQDLVEEGVTAITFLIDASLSMPSSVIGYFVKLVKRDKIALRMVIEDPRLLELLEELGLKDAFGAVGKTA